jgi:hypothetical protein
LARSPNLAEALAQQKRAEISLRPPLVEARADCGGGNKQGKGKGVVERRSRWTRAIARPEWFRSLNDGAMKKRSRKRLRFDA